MAKVAHTKHPLSFPLCRVPLLSPQDGKTPLDHAKENNKREVAALLERVLEVRLPIDRSFAFLHIDIPGIKTQSTEDTVDRVRRSTSRQWKLGMRRECRRSWLHTRSGRTPIRSVGGRLTERAWCGRKLLTQILFFSLCRVPLLIPMTGRPNPAHGREDPGNCPGPDRGRRQLGSERRGQ